MPDFAGLRRLEGRVPRIRKEHAETEERDDHAARDPHAGNRDPEETHDQAAGHQEARAEHERVDAGTPDLPLPFLLGQVLRDRHHERHRTERVDDGQDREQRACRVAEIRSEPFHVRTLAGR